MSNIKNRIGALERAVNAKIELWQCFPLFIENNSRTADYATTQGDIVPTISLYLKLPFLPSDKDIIEYRKPHENTEQFYSRLNKQYPQEPFWWVGDTNN